MAIDLTTARAAVEDLVLIDGCVITFTQPADAPIDEATGRRPDAATETVYEGACAVRPRGETESETAAGGRVDPDATHLVSLPATAPAIPRGALAEVTLSTWDPRLVGRRFEVRRELVKTMLVTRRLTAVESP